MIKDLLNKINEFILNPLIVLLFAVALLIFFVGMIQFIRSASADSGREEGKRKIVYGLIGMFVMVSAYGLIRIVLSTFGIDTDTNYISF